MITLTAVGIISYAGDIQILNGIERRVRRCVLAPLERDDNIVLEFWGKAADKSMRFKVGSTVYITGEPVFDTYPKKDGTPGMEIKVRNPIVRVIYEKKSKQVDPEFEMEETEGGMGNE